jgi:hypothetical protein
VAGAFAPKMVSGSGRVSRQPDNQSTAPVSRPANCVMSNRRSVCWSAPLHFGGVQVQQPCGVAGRVKGSCHLPVAWTVPTAAAAVREHHHTPGVSRQTQIAVQLHDADHHRSADSTTTSSAIAPSLYSGPGRRACSGRQLEGGGQTRAAKMAGMSLRRRAAA